jgi:hypothetical protein
MPLEKTEVQRVRAQTEAREPKVRGALRGRRNDKDARPLVRIDKLSPGLRADEIIGAQVRSSDDKISAKSETLSSERCANKPRFANVQLARRSGAECPHRGGRKIDSIMRSSRREVFHTRKGQHRCADPVSQVSQGRDSFSCHHQTDHETHPADAGSGLCVVVEQKVARPQRRDAFRQVERAARAQTRGRDVQKCARRRPSSRGRYPASSRMCVGSEY